MTPADNLERTPDECATASEPRWAPTWGDARRIIGQEYLDAAKGDPELLAAYRRTTGITLQLRHGVTPDGWTARTSCANCGTVPIFEGAPATVLACPWCHVRRRPDGRSRDRR